MNLVLLIAGSIVALIVLAGLVLYIIGRSLPERHTAKISVVLPAFRPAVWAAITDYAGMPAWWPDVKGIRLETRPNGEVWTWNKDARGQEIAFRTKEESAPAHLVREIMGDGLPFGGTWTFDLAARGERTEMTITEDGFIKPPLFRAIAQYFIGLDRTMKSFATHLERRMAARKQ